MQLRSCYAPLAAYFRPWEVYDAGMSSSLVRGDNFTIAFNEISSKTIWPWAV